MLSRQESILAPVEMTFLIDALLHHIFKRWKQQIKLGEMNTHTPSPVRSALFHIRSKFASDQSVLSPARGTTRQKGFVTFRLKMRNWISQSVDLWHGFSGKERMEESSLCKLVALY